MSEAQTLFDRFWRVARTQNNPIATDFVFAPNETDLFCKAAGIAPRVELFKPSSPSLHGMPCREDAIVLAGFVVINFSDGTSLPFKWKSEATPC